MKIFVDTANLDEIKELAEMGIIDGVTTNPSLMAKVGVVGEENVKEHYKKICEIVNGDVSAEVISTDYEGILKEARELAKIHKNIVVKVPMIPDGIKAIKTLSAEGIRTNCTLVFSANQALLAAKAGATYVSPFIGRLDDRAQEGVVLIEEIKQIFDNYCFSTQILAASIRSPLHMKQVAMIGSDVATAPYKVIKQMFEHPLTDLGLEKFLSDYKKAQSA
ncbi:MAG: fructose-6-phosphate aldolase [Chlorobi bacterium]|nr:fructose-6-phosphate aldolase [Chlorobiota bacterium]